MIHPHLSSIASTFLTAAALVLLPGMSPDSSEGLRASGGSFAVGLDSDGDGLHDALEARLGTNYSIRDTDSDGLDDYEEMLLGSNPLSPDNLAEFPPEPKLYLDVYVTGPDMVFQIAALTQTSVLNPLFAWGSQNGAGQASFSDLRHTVLQSSVRPSGFTGWEVKTLSLSMPAALFSKVPSMGVGMAATVDGVLLQSTTKLIHINQVLCQLREDLLASESNGGNGVFPVEPGGQLPSGSPDEVCVQTLVPSAYLPGGRIEYQVTDASCDSLAGAICLPGCANSVLETVIGIDILALLN